MKTKLSVLVFLLAAVWAQAQTNGLTALLQQGLFEEQANRNLDAAIENYTALAKQFDKDRQLAATAVFRLGECYRAQGKTNEAAAQYQRILRDFPNEKTLATLSQQNLAGMGTQMESSASTAWQQQKELLAKQIALAEQDLAEAKKKFEVGAGTTQADIRAAEREVLRLRQQLAGLGANKTELLDLSVPATSAEDQEIARFQAMIQNSPDLVNAPNGQSGTLLCVAAQKGQLRVAQFLLEHGADVQRGYPLAQAAGNGHKAMVELLLKNGAPVNAAEGDSQTALHRAAARGYLSVTETLLAAKADVNAQAENGRTPLTLAVENSVVPVAAVLLAHGADPNIVCRTRKDWGTDRKTTGAPLHLAVARGDEAMVALLLTNRADLTSRSPSPFGESALDIAATLGKPGIVRQLIAAGADVNAASTAQADKTPLHLATLGGFREIVALLLEHGANPNVTANYSGNGVTPLMGAAALGNSEIAALLLQHKADPNLADSNGNTALLNAMQKQSPAAVRALLAGGANPDNQTVSGYPTLVLAVANNAAANKEVLAALIEAKANVNLPDPEGKTALHWVAEKNRKDLVELLVKAGADVNLRTKGGVTALDYAKSHPPIVGIPFGIQPGSSAGVTVVTNELTIADLLRQHGALDELPDFTRIRITRQGVSQPWGVFRRGAKLTNQFTLLETVMKFYSDDRINTPGPAWRGSPSLPFPDFGRIIIRRPSQKPGGKDQEIKVSLLNSSNVVDCAQDVPVQFGDVIEIPESVHALNAGTPNPVREMEALLPVPHGAAFAEQLQALLAQANGGTGTNSYQTAKSCLQKSVQLVVAGETTTFKVNSWKEGFLSQALGKTEARSVLRSSSDLSRITVTRKTGSARPPAVFTVDVSGSSPNTDDLWLQDGDVIEVPEKR